jgi:hypothetical protein
MPRLTSALLLVLGMSSAALAADVKPPADSNSASTPVDPKQVVCRHVEASGQSMLPGAKVCHTRAEWADIGRQSGQDGSQSNGNGH